MANNKKITKVAKEESARLLQPIANTIAAAEHGIALLAAMACNVAQANAPIKAGKWQRSKYVAVSMIGKTLAVMGIGKFGSEVARHAKGLGMNVIAHEPYAPVDRARVISVDLVSFDEAISIADFISLHMPLIPTTNKLSGFGSNNNGVYIHRSIVPRIKDDQND